MKKNYFIAILLMAFVNLFAQHSVTFEFKDATTNAPLQGVSIRMGTTKTSDADGKVVFTAVLDGSYQPGNPTLSCYKYTTAAQIPAVVVAGADQTIPVTLSQKIPVNTFTVSNAGLTGTLLTADEVGAVYQWYNCSNTPATIIEGATARTYDVGAAGSGSYQVSATCGANANTPTCVLVNVMTQTLIVKDASGNPIPGAKVTIGSTLTTGADGKVSFVLQDGTTASPKKYGYSVAMPCYANVSVTSSAAGAIVLNGSGVAPSDINVTMVPQTLNNAVTILNDVLTATQTNNSTGVTYQWVNSTTGTDVDIAGATAKTYTVTEPGTYKVRISDCFNTVTGTFGPIAFYNVTFTAKAGTDVLPGVAVKIGTTTKLTDANGQAVFNLPKGTYNRTASLKCYNSISSGNVAISTADVAQDLAMSLSTANDVNISFGQGTGTAAGFVITLKNSVDNSIITYTTGSRGGGSNDYISQVPNGTYEYTITKPCYSKITGTIVVDCNNGLPNAISETAIVDIDATVTKNGNVLTVNATGTRYTYQWLDTNGLPIEGATSQSYTATATGSYKVQVTTVDCGTSLTSAEVFVQLYNAIVLVKDKANNAVVGATVTMGEVVKTTIGNGSVTFSNLPAGDYSYVIKKDCYVDLNGSIVLVDKGVTKTENLSHIKEPVSVLVTDSSETPNVIAGAVVTLTAEGYTQNVTTTAGAATIFPADVPYGTYTYRIVTNCYDVKEGTLTVQCNNGEGFQINAAVALTAVDKTVTQDGKTLTATATGKEYQWFNCADNTPIEGATAQTFTATTAGNYKVVITNPACTVSATSDCFEVTETILGLEHNAANVFSVYPVPVKDNLTVQMNNDFQNVSVEVVNMQGQVVLRTNFSQIKTMKLDVSDLSAGFYILNVKADNQSSSRRIIKQ